MEKCLHAIDRFNERVGVGFAYLLPLLVVVVVLQVVSRYAFRAPFVWTFEMTNFLCGGLSMLGCGYALLHKSHVRIDVLWGRFSERGKAIADLVTFVFLLAFAMTLLWLGIKATWAALQPPWETTITPWSPVIWPVKMLLPIAGFLFLLQGVANFLRDFRMAVTRTRGEA